ncbi:hypothetical protein [Vibrio diabolicus]|uniref:hypothetical protein n=1 Tax=Vibrio diabolicus TaxID=50719 RepID=UPI003D7CF252
MAISARVRSIILSESLGVCARCMRDIGANGEVAHIVAETYDGPRGDTPLPLEKRNEPDNLLYLCVACHREEVDKYPDKYPVEMLQGMKLRLQTMRRKFNDGQVNYYHALFHGTSPQRVAWIFSQACRGIQIHLSYDDHHHMGLFKANIESTLIPASFTSQIQTIRDTIDVLIETFDKEGEEFQDSPTEIKTRVMFYSENDPDTYHRRDEFWELYYHIENLCSQSVAAINYITKANVPPLGFT